MAARRVFVTGIGLVTPLGISRHSSWKALLTPSLSPNADVYPVSTSTDAGAPQTVVMRVANKKNLPRPRPLLGRDVPPYAHYALCTAAEALVDAGLDDVVPETAAPRIGVSFGVGMAHIADLTNAHQQISAGKPRRVSPFLVPRILLNTPAGLIAQVHNLQGPNLAPSTACAAGAHAIIDGYHAILRDDADAMLVGGSEAAIEDVSVVGFMRAKALSTAYVDKPLTASRPFDRDRDGFVMGEGGAALLLESETHMRARGTTEAYAEIVGTGSAGDAWHITSPSPDGRGAEACMRSALRRLPNDRGSPAALAVNKWYINAHATSTPVGDAIERAAIARVFPAHGQTFVSATKSATGHLLGAAGAVEAAFSALTLATGFVPPTRNLSSLDEDENSDRRGWHDIDRYVPGQAKAFEAQFALSNSFGFGGTNASIVFQRPDCGFAIKEG